MAPVIPLIAAAAAASGTFVGFGTLGTALLVGFVSTVANYALAPKPKTPQFNAPERQLSDRLQSIRQPITTGRLNYGRLRLGGAQTFVEKPEGSNTTHILYTIGAAPGGYEAFDELWFNDEQVPLGAYNASTGYAISGKYSGKAKVWFGNGTPEGDADLHAALTAAVGSDMWGPNDKQTGWAKLYVQIIWDNDTYPGGIPNVTGVFRCLKAIKDPRVSPTYTGYTDNAELCIAHYLTTEKKWGGFGSAWSEINESELIAGANACDEMAARKAATVTFTASGDLLTVADKSAALRTGTRLTGTTTGTLPDGLEEDTNYFWIATGPLTGKVATSLANARAGIPVTLNDAGTGTHTINVNAEPRYTCNGTVESSDDPETIITRMLSAMAGRLLRNQGQWKPRAGVWQGADGSLGQGDIIEGFRVNWFREPRDVFNGVKGTFTDPDSSWQPTDFPVVQVAQYVSDDQGLETWKDADLPFTVSPSMAQRICRIDLERNRRQISTGWTTKLTALDVAAGDIVALDWPRYGWAGKYFECSSYKPVLRSEGDAPYLCLQLGFAEMDENVYLWTPADDEAAYQPSPRTNLPNLSVVLPPGPPAVTEQVYETTGSRGVAVKALLSWAASQDTFVREYQPSYRLVGAADWITLPWTPGTTAEILDIDPGIYDFRVVARNILLVESDETAAVTRKEIRGLSDAPSTPAGLTLQKFGGQVLINLPPHPALDVRIGGRYLVRHSEATSDASWSESFSIGNAEGYPGNSAYILLPMKPGSYLIRAIDSSDTQSPGWATVTTDGADTRVWADVDLLQEDDDFVGEHDGTIASGGILRIAGIGEFDDIPDFDAISSLDDFGGIAPDATYYFASGLDLGAKRRVRLLSIIQGLISNSNDLIDDRATNIDDWVSFDGDDGGSSADCWVEVRTTDDDPSDMGANWSAWNRVDSTEVHCRGVQARARLTSSDPAYNILISILRLKVEEVA
jgi:hypothetical protein